MPEHLNDATTEAWRKAIATAVRRNCTIDWETAKKGGDALIYAVADWIENPPEWVVFEAPETALAGESDYKVLVEVALARYKLACDEMDRLTSGNPGYTWRWSIPANPDRDSDLILSASVEDVPRLVSAVEALLAMEQRLTDHIVQLAAERDAAQHIIESHRCGENVELAYRRTLDAQAERDALRTENDKLRKLISDNHEAYMQAIGVKGDS